MLGISPPSPEAAALISELGRKYLWWTPVGDAPHALLRSIAQIMNLGGYNDIQRLEAVLHRDLLVEVMRMAQPGWFTARSWEFWRGRLSLANEPIISTEPPRRALPLVAQS